MRASVGIIGLVVGAVALLQGAVPAQNAARMAPADRKFALAAAQGGLAEVKLGELASKQGAKDTVKQFGQRMVTDHGKANADLMAVAQRKGLKLPTSIDSEHSAMYTRLSKLHGAAFDSAYIKAMREDHAKDVKEFEKESMTGQDADIKGFAQRTLPVIKEHYQMISDMSVRPKTTPSVPTPPHLGAGPGPKPGK